MSDAVPIGDTALYRTVSYGIASALQIWGQILQIRFLRRLHSNLRLQLQPAPRWTSFHSRSFHIQEGSSESTGLFTWARKLTFVVKEHCRVHTLPSYPSCYYTPHVPQSLPDHHLTDVAQSIPESSAATNAENEHVWQRLCHRGEAYTGSQAQKEWALDYLSEPAEIEKEGLQDDLDEVDELERRGRFRTPSGREGSNYTGWEEHAPRMDSGLASGPTTQHSLTADQATTARGPILVALDAFTARQYTILQALDTCPTHGTSCSRMASTPAGSLASFRGPSQAGPTSAAPTTTGQ